MRNDLKTSETAEHTTSSPSMLSAGGSPARTSATPVRELELTETGRVYGGRCVELLGNLDPATRSLRTSQLCLDGELSKFSQTLPRSGMTRNGKLYRRQTLARRTLESESGLWPTPAACVPNLGEKVETWLARRERVKLTAKNGNGMGMPLSIAVKLWPTPSVYGNHNRKGASASSGDGLSTAVKVWPTIRSSDAERGGRGDLIQAVRGNPNSHYKFPTPHANCHTGAGEHGTGAPNLQTVAGGSLNPTWVEWLMGYPGEWTALPPSETL